MFTSNEVCEWNPAHDQWFKEAAAGPSSKNACQVRAGNSCGSGSLIGWDKGGSLVLTNAHVVGSKIGTAARCRFNFGDGDIEREGRIIMAAYSTRITADWAVLFIPDWQPVRPVWGSRRRPTSSERFHTSGAPKCVWPLRHQTGLRIISNNGAGFAVWDQPAIGGQSGSGVWSLEDGFQRLLLTWRTNNNNGAGQPLDYIYEQAQAAIQTGVLLGGAKPDDVTELSDIHPDTAEGFVCEMSIRSLPIWAEDQKPQPGPDPDPEQPPSELPVSKQALIESYRKIRDEATGMIARLEGASDIPKDPPKDGPTFGL